MIACIVSNQVKCSGCQCQIVKLISNHLFELFGVLDATIFGIYSLPDIDLSAPQSPNLPVSIVEDPGRHAGISRRVPTRSVNFAQ